jgi:hypothetical protein
MNEDMASDELTADDFEQRDESDELYRHLERLSKAGADGGPRRIAGSAVCRLRANYVASRSELSRTGKTGGMSGLLTRGKGYCESLVGECMAPTLA